MKRMFWVTLGRSFPSLAGAKPVFGPSSMLAGVGNERWGLILWVFAHPPGRRAAAAPLRQPAERSKTERVVGNWNKGKLQRDTDGAEEWLAGVEKRESGALMIRR